MKYRDELPIVAILTLWIVAIFIWVSGCSDDRGVTEIEFYGHDHGKHHQNKHNKYWPRECDEVVDSLEAELRGCRE